MGTILRAFCLGAALSACVALPSVPAVLFDGVTSLFRGKPVSLPVDMRMALVLTQRGLRQLHYDVDVLEQTPKGYQAGFGDQELTGIMRLEKKAAQRVTFSVRVYKDLLRQGELEERIIAALADQFRATDTADAFDYSGYVPLYGRPKAGGARIGWYHLGALVQTEDAYVAGWLKVSLPSGRKGYLQK